MISVSAWQSLDSRSETGRGGGRAQSLSDYPSFWPNGGVSFRRLRYSNESQWPRLFEIKSQNSAVPSQRELTCCLKVLGSDLEKNVTKGESDPRTPDGDNGSHHEQ